MNVLSLRSIPLGNVQRHYLVAGYGIACHGTCSVPVVIQSMIGSESARAVLSDGEVVVAKVMLKGARSNNHASCFVSN